MQRSPSEEFGEFPARIRQLDERRYAGSSEWFLGLALEITTPSTTGEYDGNTSSGAHRRGDRGGSVLFFPTSAFSGPANKVWTRVPARGRPIRRRTEGRGGACC